MNIWIKTIGALAVAGGVYFAATHYQSLTQSSIYDRQAVRNLDVKHPAAGLLGFVRDEHQHDMVAGLHTSEGKDWTVHLKAGKSYAIVGACDSDCSDVDLKVRNTDGDDIATDVATDNNPAVTIDSAYDQDVVVRLYMASCENQTCSAAARVLSR